MVIFHHPHHGILLTSITHIHAPPLCIQGSVVIRQRRRVVVKVDGDGNSVERERSEPTVLHCDIIREEPFWKENPVLR